MVRRRKKNNASVVIFILRDFDDGFFLFFPSEKLLKGPQRKKCVRYVRVRAWRVVCDSVEKKKKTP